MKISEILKKYGIDHFTKWSDEDILPGSGYSHEALYDIKSGTVFFNKDKFEVIEELKGFENKLLIIFNSIINSKGFPRQEFPVEYIDLFFLQKERNEKLEKILE